MLRTVFLALAWALAMGLSGGKISIGDFGTRAVGAPFTKAGGVHDPNGVNAAGDAGGMFDPDGAQASAGVGNRYDPSAVETDQGNVHDPNG